MKANHEAVLDRRDVMAAVQAARGDVLMVTGLGSTTYDAGTADHPNTFYLWGGMGAAAMMGLGLALAQPKRRVLVMTGDGEMLMGIGAFATIGAQAPDNFALAVIDNGHYSETGMQPTHVSRGVDLAGIATACGFKSETVRERVELDQAIGRMMSDRGPLFFDIKVTTQRYPMSIKLRDGAHLKNRFRENLLGPVAFD